MSIYLTHVSVGWVRAGWNWLARSWWFCWYQLGMFTYMLVCWLGIRWPSLDSLEKLTPPPYVSYLTQSSGLVWVYSSQGYSRGLRETESRSVQSVLKPTLGIGTVFISNHSRKVMWSNHKQGTEKHNLEELQIHMVKGVTMGKYKELDQSCNWPYSCFLSRTQREGKPSACHGRK